MIIAIFVLIPFFSLADPISVSSGSAGNVPARSGPLTQDVGVQSAAYDAICCGTPLPRDRPPDTGNECFAYSLTVVHFRKLRNK